MEQHNYKGSIYFRLFKWYSAIYHNLFYYSKFFIVNKDLVPKVGSPLIIACDHQNCINDPLAIIYSLPDRKLHFLTRADIFKTRGKKLFESMGMLPAYRIDFDGIESLQNNQASFEITKDELLKGNTIGIFPEAGHQNKRWLGDFSFGYLRIAFQAAEKDNFLTDIQIIPCCNHYSNYFPLRAQAMIKFGDPISLAPYYDSYKVKPRTTQRTVNKIIHDSIANLMLNITDLENYDAIDYLRNTYGIQYAKKNSFNPNYLPDKLLSDKKLVDKLNNLKEKDPESIGHIYDNILTIKKLTKDYKIRDYNFTDSSSTISLIGELLFLLFLFPLYLFALIPNVLIHFIPTYFFHPKDELFQGGLYFAISVVVTIPLLYGICFAIFWINTSIIPALIYLLLLPILGIFAWHYAHHFKKIRQRYRFHKLKKNKEFMLLTKLREGTFSLLDTLLNNQ